MDNINLILNQFGKLYGFLQLRTALDELLSTDPVFNGQRIADFCADRVPAGQGKPRTFFERTAVLIGSPVVHAREKHRRNVSCPPWIMIISKPAFAHRSAPSANGGKNFV
jgi:hypothetical protein